MRTTVRGLFMGAVSILAILQYATTKHHLRFRNRIAAGKLLGTILRSAHNRHFEDIIVLGIPRGGVMVGHEVAKKLSANFDIAIARRLVSQYNEEITVGAVMDDGTYYLNQDLITELGISHKDIDSEISFQIDEITRKKTIYLDGQRLIEERIRNRTVILVDDGAASGATVIAAVRWTKKFKPRQIVAALPVASKQTIRLIKKEADRVECIIMPDISAFSSIEQFYVDFSQLTDNQVIEVLRTRGL